MVSRDSSLSIRVGMALFLGLDISMRILVAGVVLRAKFVPLILPALPTTLTVCVDGSRTHEFPKNIERIRPRAYLNGITVASRSHA